MKIVGHPWWLTGEECACYAEDAGSILGREDPLEQEMATHSSIPAGQMSLAGHRPRGRKVLDTT